MFDMDWEEDYWPTIDHDKKAHNDYEMDKLNIYLMKHGGNIKPKYLSDDEFNNCNMVWANKILINEVWFAYKYKHSISLSNALSKYDISVSNDMFHSCMWLGKCCTTIKINSSYIENELMVEKDVREIVGHIIAHLLLENNQTHDNEWVNKCKELGIVGHDMFVFHWKTQTLYEHTLVSEILKISKIKRITRTIVDNLKIQIIEDLYKQGLYDKIAVDFIKLCVEYSTKINLICRDSRKLAIDTLIESNKYSKNECEKMHKKVISIHELGYESIQYMIRDFLLKHS